MNLKKTIFGLANFTPLETKGQHGNKRLFVTGLKKKFRKSIVVIGVFDGLHLGHQHLIKGAVFTARRLGRKSLCITFHPHPQKLPYLISLEHRLNLIEELGVDYCIVLRFDKNFSKITPEDFIKNILVGVFHPSHIFVGEKFRFGYRARGNVKLLRAYKKDFAFRVLSIKELSIGKRIISSNIIRSLITNGRLRDAEKLLGRKVSVLGTVIRGLKRGRILGYPTANIDPHHEVLPKSGVYLVRIIYPVRSYRVKGKTHKGLKKIYYGLCNIGKKPTFAVSEDIQTIEVHLLDFKNNIYGKDLYIEFICRIRPEKKFSSNFHLVSQIAKDRQKALRIIKTI